MDNKNPTAKDGATLSILEIVQQEGGISVARNTKPKFEMIES